MTVADVPGTGRLFLKIFRGPSVVATPDLLDYLAKVAFGAPLYDAALGSVVYADDEAVRSAILAVPMQFVAHGRPLPARLLCAFMTDGESEAAGAAAVALTFRAKRQDLAFSDSASPKSRAHWQAVGGVVLPVQNLEWTRILRPLSALIDRIEQRALRGCRLGLGSMTRPLDALIRAASTRAAPPPAPDLRVSEMPLDAFLDEAPGLIAHYAVRPLWPRQELAWLVELASQRVDAGPLRIRAVQDRADDTVGCFLYYGKAGCPAHVLNVLARRGREDHVVAAMMHDLDHAGCTEVVGRAQPALMQGLATQSMLKFRHKAFACITTRHADIVAAAERGDIYIGGLAGESWSRLMSDFR